jgi:hypothetical protein
LQRFIILVLVLALSGCAQVTPDEAIAVTRRYINMHQLPLPTGYDVKSEEMLHLAMNEANGHGEAFDAHIVTYSAWEVSL